MGNAGNILSKENSLILRGLAILSIWGARDERPGKWVEKTGKGLAFLLLLFFGALAVAMNARLVPWLAVPIAGLFAFFALAKLAVRVRPLDGALKWIGSISAGIFVCHPIVRGLLFRKPLAEALKIDIGPVPGRALLFSLLVYAVLTFVLAFFYQKFQNGLAKRFLPRNGKKNAAGMADRTEQAMVDERSEA